MNLLNIQPGNLQPYKWYDYIFHYAFHHPLRFFTSIAMGIILIIVVFVLIKILKKNFFKGLGKETTEGIRESEIHWMSPFYPHWSFWVKHDPILHKKFNGDKEWTHMDFVSVGEEE